MKFIVIGASVVLLACISVHGKVLPDYLDDILCSRKNPQFSKCMLEGFEKSRPYLAKGIPEIDLPGLDPLKMTYFRVNRKLNDFVSVNLTLINSKTTGMMGLKMEKMLFDPKRLQGEVAITIPNSVMETEYKVNGQLFVVPLRSEGYFRGNFTNTKIYAKGNWEEYVKDGVRFYKVGKANMKFITGGAYVKMVAKNPVDQPAADLISSFFNENPRRVLDAVNPIAVDTAIQLFREIIDKVLAKVPADEILPA